MDSLKNWLLEYGVKKFGPSAIRGGIAFGLAWTAAHQGLLEKFGIFYDAAQKIITIHIDALTGSLDLALFAALAGLIKTLNHQAVQLTGPTAPAGQTVPPPSTPGTPR